MSGDAARWLLGGLILLAVAALFVAMVRTWRTRVRKQADTVPPVGVPTDLSPAAGSWDGFTVATTRADQPLERITAGGLGFRGRGGVTVHATGVVEPGGLVRLRWTATGAAGATDLDTYFRFPEGDAAPLHALQELATKHNHPQTAGEGTNS
jgi:hypothetical protein